MSKNHIVKALAKRLRGAKAEAKVTNADAGESLGYTASAVSRWLADPGKLSVLKLIALSEVYGMDLPKAWDDAYQESRENLP